MQLTVINENEDGSVDVRLDNIEPEIHQIIMQAGFLKILQDHLDKETENNNVPALFKKPV